MGSQKTIKNIILSAMLLSGIAAGAAEQRGAKEVAPTAAKRPSPAATTAVPEVDERDFIDAGVLEGGDVLESGLEIGGLLVDETITKFGHDLFNAFNRAWKPLENARYNLVFGERIDAVRGSLVNIKLNDSLIFEGFLTPREEAITELGKGLAKDIRNLIRNTASLEEEELY